MDTVPTAKPSLETIPADRRLVDELSAHGLISPQARAYALDLLYPAKNWGLWASRLLLVLGVALILSGIVYFFAFNWTKITPLMKLGGLQCAVLACLGAAYAYGLARLSGQLALLSATVMVGVFLAAFGQVYQTGADAYTLFVTWAVLTLPWVVLSRFAALWMVWLVVSNAGLTLYWLQASPGADTEIMLFPYLALFNGLFLGAREWLAHHGTAWLAAQWTRVVLVVPILASLLIPSIVLIVDPDHPPQGTLLGAGMSLVVHGIFYVAYRYKTPNMWSLAATVLSGCTILEAALLKLLLQLFSENDASLSLLMGMLTLGVFTTAIVQLRRIARITEGSHV